MRSTLDRQPPATWHTLAAEAVLELSRTCAGGLTQAEADTRLQTHGPNRLAEVEPPRLLARLLRQFNNLLLYVLMAAALITALMDHWVDTSVIMAVVVLNAVIGFVQEGKAEKALQAIRHLLSPHAVVLGKHGQSATEDLLLGSVTKHVLAEGSADVLVSTAR